MRIRKLDIFRRPDSYNLEIRRNTEPVYLHVNSRGQACHICLSESWGQLIVLGNSKYSVHTFAFSGPSHYQQRL